MIRNLFSMSAMRILSACLTLAMIASIAHIWGLAALGNFVLLLAVFFAFQLLPLLGLNLHVVREVAAHPDMAKEHAATASIVSICTSIVFFCIVGWGGGWLYRDLPGLHHSFWVVAACLLPTALIIVAESILLAQQRMQVVAWVNVLEGVTRTAMSISVVHFGGGLQLVMVVFLVCRVGALAVYMRHAEVPPLVAPGRFSKTIALEYRRVLPSFLGIAVCAALFTRLDILILSKVSTPEQLGLYAVPARIFDLSQMVPQIVMVVAFPRIVTTWRDRSEALPWLVAALTVLPLMLLAPILMLACVHASNVLSLFGKDAPGGAHALVFLLVATTAVGIGQLLGACMLAAQRNDLDLRSLAFACAMSTIGLVYVVPAWGATGAASVTLVVLILSTILRLVLLRNLMQLRPLITTLLWIAAPVVCMAASLYTFDAMHPVAGGVIAVAVYAMATGAVIQYDKPRWIRIVAALREVQREPHPNHADTPAGTSNSSTSATKAPIEST